MLACINKKDSSLNLNKLYTTFKRDIPELKITISKFCDLRSKNCVTVGARGIHFVCVCKIHQDFLKE